MHVLTGLCVPDPDRICGVAEVSTHSSWATETTGNVLAVLLPDLLGGAW